MIPQITIISSSVPTSITKQFSLQNGDLVKRGGGILVKGQVEIVELDGHESFKTILTELGPHQAITYGLPSISPASLVTKEEWKRLGKPKEVISRSDTHFKWSDGPGVMMLDYDPSSESKTLSQQELIKTVREAIPGLADVTMIWWSSASSFIKNQETGEELTNLRGQRLYFFVRDAMDIPRAGNALVEYLWANGDGYFEVSKSGSLLSRTVVDKSVWQPSRLDFASGADCTRPLQQNRGEPIIISGKIEIADTRALIPDPVASTIAEAASNRNDARKAKADEVVAVREQWVNERINIITQNNPSDQEKATARETVLRAVEHNCLSGDYPLCVVENGREIEVSVNAVLENLEKYHHAVTLDPIEPDYDGRRTVGKMYLIGSQPNLYSFAHGGCTFRLRRQISDIEIRKGRLPDTVEDTLEVLRSAPGIYDFGGALVAVERGQIFPLDHLSLTHYLGGLIQYWQRTKAGEGWQKALMDPSERLVRLLVSLGDRRLLKKLEAVVTGPTLRPDGSVMDSPGYDEETGLLYEADDCPCSIPVSPDIAEVRNALEILWRPFLHFPTVKPLDRGILLSALLTAAARPAFDTCPAFGFDAPTQASGKTLLATAVGALATGHVPPIWPHTVGGGDEEARKRLFVALRQGNRALVWDNVIGVFNSAAMSTAITSSSLTDRVLGTSEKLSIPNRTVILLTGNNLTLGGDLARRVLKCRIDPQTERPYARKFEFDPVVEVLKNRQALLAAALTIIRGFLSSGAPSEPSRMASFEVWDDYVRQTVIWVGREVVPGKFEDPMNAVIEAQATDPEQETSAELFAAIHELFGNEWNSASEIQRAATEHIGCDKAVRLQEVLNELKMPGRILTSKSLGRILANRRGRIVDGLQLSAKKNNSSGSLVWRVGRIAGD